MAFFSITAMTLFAVVTFVWLIASSQGTNLYSVRNLFLAAWLYYGFAVGIDLISGVEIPYTAGEVYMMDPTTWDSVAFVMWNYVVCGVAFIVTYFVMQGSREIRPLELQYDLRTPHEWCLVLIHVLAAYVYVKVFFGMDRMERIAMAQIHAYYKFATLIVPITLALDMLVILTGNERKSLVSIGLALLLSLVTGNRNYVLFVFLVGAFHWRPAMRGWKLIGMVTSCACIIFAFKTLYGVGLGWWMGQRVDANMIYDNLHLTLSGLDADASYVIAIFYTDQPSPLWLGKSYFHTSLLLAWPRFLGGIDVSTLAEDYVWRYHITTAERGGAMAFSAIAEAWLNFSYIGPLLLGLFWGAVANLFDRRPRGVMYFVVLMMTARLFRSDAASLFKNWVLVWGAMFVIAISLLTIYTVIVEPRLPVARRWGYVCFTKEAVVEAWQQFAIAGCDSHRNFSREAMVKSLRICHIIHNTEFGGTETMLFRVLRQLSGQHEMSVVSLMRCGEIGERIRQLGIPVYAMECARNRNPRPEKFIGFVSQIRKLRPEVVQTWAYHADLCGGVAARLATKAAVVWNIRHATLDPKVDSKNVLRSAGLCARLSKWVPDRILLNAHSAVDVHANAGYDRRKMQVLPNGFDVDRFCPRPDDKLTIRNELRIPSDVPVVGMCGRFHPHKGQAEFVKVAGRVANDWPTTHFLIAGNQCDDANVELTTWIENAGLTGRFRLLGPRNDIPQILNAMDVYLLPSVTEGMPNVVGEAMACGVSTVSTDVGDAARLIGDCGTVVPSEDIPAMASAVISFLAKTEAERQAFGARARKRIVDHFDINAVAPQYASTWLETLDRRAVSKRTSRTLASVVPTTALRFDQAETSDGAYRPS